MHIINPRECDIRYNASIGSFEACITVRDFTGAYVYAVSVTAPIYSELAVIARNMAETARRIHLNPAKGLHLRQTPESTARLAA